MKKASNILIRIGMILSAVAAGLLLVSAIAFIICGTSQSIRQMLIDGYYDGSFNTDIDDADQFAMIIQLMLVFYGVFFIIFGGLCLASSIVSSMTLRNPSKGRLIACIIFGAMSTELSLIGGILGLVALNRERNEPQIE